MCLCASVPICVCVCGYLCASVCVCLYMYVCLCVFCVYVVLIVDGLAMPATNCIPDQTLVSSPLGPCHDLDGKCLHRLVSKLIVLFWEVLKTLKEEGH